MTANPQTCRRCGSPLTPGMKFCESCGAKIHDLPACLQCGAALGANARFCESCGAPVSQAAAPAVTIPAVAAPLAAPVSPAPDTPSPRESRSPAEPMVKETPAEVAAVAAMAAAWSRADAVDDKTIPPRGTDSKKPMSGQTMLIAGILVLALLGAGVYFVVLPLLSGAGTTPPVSVPPAVPSPAGSPAAPAAGSSTVTLTAGPTQVLPVNRDLIIDVERDAISSIITVKFQGGGGQYAVRELAVTLTRSDGTVERKSFRPEFRGTFITLQGTQKTDRVEITAHFYNGESYKVVDKVFEYKRRSG